MRGVVLAGGRGTRLDPLTQVTNKHLLPVYDKPMIFYPIQTLVRAGVTEVLVVTGGPHAGHFLRVLKNGDSLGLAHLEYAFQEGSGGIPAALALAEEFADSDFLAVILGDNTTDADIYPAVSGFREGAKVFLKQVPDPERFGVPRFNSSGRIMEIVEKSADPPSEFAVTGLYIYDASVFDRIRTLTVSGRGELEVTDLNNTYLDDGLLQWEVLEAFWTDAGEFSSYARAFLYWKERCEK